MLGNQFAAFMAAPAVLCRASCRRSPSSAAGLAADDVRRAAAGRPRSVGDCVSQGDRLDRGFLTSLWSGGAALISVVVAAGGDAGRRLLSAARLGPHGREVDGWLPRHQRETVREPGARDRHAHRRLRARAGTVCLLLGLFYAVALSLVGLNFGLLIGLFTGLLSFIPLSARYRLVVWSASRSCSSGRTGPVLHRRRRSSSSASSSRAICSLRTSSARSIGLHPVWLMFALLAFGSLFGFVGLLLAVPVAAAIGVLVRFALRHYLASPLFTGASLR
ncbi:MAG: AI-2E family transporter [Piscinibacter sp.]